MQAAVCVIAKLLLVLIRQNFMCANAKSFEKSGINVK